MTTYRHTDIDGDWLEVRPGNRGAIKIDTFDACTEHRVIATIPVEHVEELVAAIRAAAEAARPA